MKRVDILVSDPLNHISQSASICEPVEDSKAIDNALLRFGLKSSDLNIIADHAYEVQELASCRMIQGVVKEGTRLVSINMHDC